MSRLIRITGLTLAALALSACTQLGREFSTGRVEEATQRAIGGPTFTEQLAVQYAQLAAREEYENFDFIDSEYYAQRSLDAQRGEVVPLPDPDAADIPSSYIGAIRTARDRLAQAFSLGARDFAPAASARAQTRLECWIEEQEEIYQAREIARCRDQFYLALAEVDAALNPTVQPREPVLPAEGALPRVFTVFFRHDLDEIEAASSYVLDDVARSLAALNYDTVVIDGHADRSGGRPYNVGLSDNRAEMVRAALIDRGVDPRQILIAAYGEDRPAVPTRDGVRLPANRRVEITLR